MRQPTGGAVGVCLVVRPGCGMTTGLWAVSWLPKGAHAPTTTWHETSEAAEVAEWRLEYAGVKNRVRWFDAAVYEGAV